MLVAGEKVVRISWGSGDLVYYGVCEVSDGAGKGEILRKLFKLEDFYLNNNKLFSFLIIE